MIVIDASVILSWFFANETGTSAITERVIKETAIVPSIFFYEVTNALLVAHRRGRVDADAPAAALEHLPRLPIQVDTSAEYRHVHPTCLLHNASALRSRP